MVQQPAQADRMQNVRRAGGVLAKIASVIVLGLGIDRFHWLWTPSAILAGLVLMMVGTTLAPRRPRRAPSGWRQSHGSPFNRGGRSWRPEGFDTDLPRPGASRTDGM